MDDPDPTAQHQSTEHVESPGRRVFLKGVAATLSSYAIWQMSGINGSTAVAAPEYLRPRYLPPGYELIASVMDEADDTGRGQTEYITWYANSETAQEIDNLIAIHQTPAPRPSWLTSMQLDHGQSYPLPLMSGKTIFASYVDSWKIRPQRDDQPGGVGLPMWNSGDEHALTFTVGNLSIALFGSRVAGISRNELMQIAGSLA